MVLAVPTDRLRRLNGPSAGLALCYEAFHAEKLMKHHRETAKNPVGIDFDPQERHSGAHGPADRGTVIINT